MRLIPLLPVFSLLFIAACTEGVGPGPTTTPLPEPIASTPTPVPVSEPTPEPAHGDDDVDEPARRVARLTVDGATSDGRVLRLEGKVEDASVPAVFRLRTENGCARAVKLPTMTTGIAFRTTLDPAALAETFGCAIDVEAGDELSETITIDPNATVTKTADGLDLNPSFSIVAAEIDPSAGHHVMFDVESKTAILSATITIGGKSWPARVVGTETSQAVFEVPAMAWAEAAITGGHADIEARLDGGAVRTMRLAPEARADMLHGEDEGGEMVEDCH